MQKQKTNKKSTKYSMKKLLIITVYAEHDRSYLWFDLQKKFIKANTQEYDHLAIVPSQLDQKRFTDCIVLPTDTVDHIPGLYLGWDYAIKNPYENYLILDSDAFPVTENWQDRLLRRMGDKLISAPIRLENLDAFPHISALFVKQNGMHLVDFDKRPTTTIVGKVIHDTGTRMRNHNKDLYPLLRSNVVNLHPMIAGIYGNLFYHHAAGSRRPFFRSERYWNPINIEKKDKLIWKLLMKEPERFIEFLKGSDLNESLKRVFPN